MIKDNNKVYRQLKVGFTKYNITSKAPYILAKLCTIAQTLKHTGGSISTTGDINVKINK